MAKYEVYQCDVCSREQSQVSGIHWTQGFGGPGELSFEKIVSSQKKIRWEILCPRCCEIIYRAVEKAVLDIRGGSK